MRFRELTPRDAPECVRLLQAHGERLDARVARALPRLWSQLAAASVPHPTMLIEDEEAPGQPLLCVVPAHFVRRSFIERLLQSPGPCARGVLGALYGSMLDGERPLLELDEVRAANSADGLDALIGHPGYVPRPWHDPLLVRIRRVAPLAFIHTFGGYRLRSLYHEALGAEAVAYLRAGGFRPAHGGTAAAAADRDGCNPPQLYVKHRDEVAAGAIDLLAAHVFHCEPHRLGLTPAEQRIVLRALLGECDRRIAATLRLSTETVRSAWDSIYGRIERIVPGVFESGPADALAGPAVRGTEKRRTAVEYLRQNLHELRPHRGQDAPARKRPSARTSDTSGPSQRGEALA